MQPTTPFEFLVMLRADRTCWVWRILAAMDSRVCEGDVRRRSLLGGRKGNCFPSIGVNLLRRRLNTALWLQSWWCLFEDKASGGR
jgi:hypothetical protein